MTMLKRHKRIEKSKTPIEEIITKTPIDERLLRRDIWIEGIVLALPLLISFAFYANIIFKTAQPVTGSQLSPSEDITSLVVFVFAFIMIYSIFLIFEYSNLKKRLKQAYLKK